MSLLRTRTLAAAGLSSVSLSAFGQGYANSGGAGCLGGGIIWLIGLAIGLALTYYVYTDAKKRGMDNAPLWAILTFFTGLIGLILYLIFRKK